MLPRQVLQTPSLKPPISQEQDALTRSLQPVCILLHKAHLKYQGALEDGKEPLPFDTWKVKMSAEHPQFLYWCRVLDLELCVLQLVRSLREPNFHLNVESLGQIVPWVFALDHTNYARWLSVHIRDMCLLSTQTP